MSLHVSNFSECHVVVWNRWCEILFYLFNPKVKFLKELLEAWKAEVEKKPPSLSVEEALKILNLKKKFDE